jgi:hypothetical protein
LAGTARCRDLLVRYYLLVGNMTGDRRPYGVLVKGGADAVLLPGITCSRRRVMELLRLLVRGRVTPVTARDVAEDWLLI